jgi:hypothetical protein
MDELLRHAVRAAGRAHLGVLPGVAAVQRRLSRLSLASITAGGPAPIIAVYSFQTFETSLAVAAFMSVTALISLMVLWLLLDRSGALDHQ